MEIDKSHPLSLKGNAEKIFSKIEPEFAIPENQLIFPSSTNIYKLKDMISKVGGIGISFAGVGIHGHLAFNEPEVGIRWTDPRLIYINDFTITIGSIRAGVGGNLINYPRKAPTLGMNQLLSAAKLWIYIRNDIPGIDWANTVLRHAVLGSPGDDFPVIYIRSHKDWLVIADRNTASIPKFILQGN